MNLRVFAVTMGLVFATVGVAGLVGLGVGPPHAGDPPLWVSAGAGRLFGLFPVNFLHNVVHLLVGLAGLAAAGGLYRERTFARVLALFYGALALAGAIAPTSTLFGLVPLHSHDVWLHAGTAVVSAYFAFIAPPTPQPGAPAG